MAENKTTQLAEEGEVLQKAVSFWETYNKKIIYAGAAIIVAIVGWFLYVNNFKEPRENEAATEIFAAENLFGKMAAAGFNKDSVNKVLNGGELDGKKITGLLKVMSQYDGSAAANRAKYMAGACYLQIKEFDKAIQYLKEFRGNGAHQMESRAYVMLGHAYAEKNMKQEALDCYKKAASVNEKDESVSPDALMIAASYADETGNSKEAIELFRNLKDKYPTAYVVSSGEVDKCLAKLGELK
jgi:tetratricopeptide (TPR) repeat protein